MKRIYTLLTALTTMFSICNAQTTEQPMPTIKQITKGNNEISITLINHGSLAVEYKGFVIQIDPVANFGGKQFDYKKNFTKTDVILVTHEHGDHLNPQTIEQLSSADTKILLNAKSQAQLGKGEIMNNGDEVTVGEIKIKAVPAYNTTPGRENFHPKGNGNGYLLTIDGTQIYISGDTEDIPEMKELKDIDLAFLSANQPYTMTPQQLVNAAKMFEPARLVPYHLGETSFDAIRNGLDTEATFCKYELWEQLR